MRRLNIPRFFALFLLLLLVVPQSVLSQASTSVTLRADVNTSANSILDSTNGVGSWIWAQTTHDKQSCRLWRSFEIPRGKVKSAGLRITADDSYVVFLDGLEIGRGSEWVSLTSYDLSHLLRPGTHVLAVEAFNDRVEAGVILGLRIEMADGHTIEVASDSSWKVVPGMENDWKTVERAPSSWPSARVVGRLGDWPWSESPWPVHLLRGTAPRPIQLKFWQQGWFQITLLLICLLAVALCVRLVGQLAVQSRAQQLLQSERARIARDIHDDLGAGLTQVVLLGELAQADLPSSSQTRTQIDELCEKARSVLGAMDEVIWLVNSRRDTLHDFATYVCKYTQTFLRSTSLRCRFEIPTDLPETAFDLPVRRNLFLAIKEALNNAAKYSQGSELVLGIQVGKQDITVTVRDNGRGFLLDAADAERNGLTNMAQRMHEVGGTFAIDSRPGAGCEVRFTTPLSSTKRRWFRK